ncbi:transcription initiation factor TFIIE subunit beta [Clonorchis sinensis]|uniref:Transcription initiation factor TFIIE subunit beta n=2 Tax=Clonorchis sinensis TaxID=79923 RepID=G7Y4E5_CLOSI|nr:transcription initiation factor TFIIE subunit beta [Clonorchis sinensis]
MAKGFTLRTQNVFEYCTQFRQTGSMRSLQLVVSCSMHGKKRYPDFIQSQSFRYKVTTKSDTLVLTRQFRKPGKRPALSKPLVLRNKDLRGRVILVTEAGCGMGRMIATSLTSYGAAVVCACARCPPDARPLIPPDPCLISPHSGGLFWIPCDLNDLSTVSQFCQIGALQMLYKRTHVRRKYPPNCGLTMSSRLMVKPLQVHCQARRTNQQRPDHQPINARELAIFLYATTILLEFLVTEATMGHLSPTVATQLLAVTKRLQQNCQAHRTAKPYDVVIMLKITWINDTYKKNTWVTFFSVDRETLTLGSCECNPHGDSSGLTSDGFEVTIQRNYLAQMLLLHSMATVIERTNKTVCKPADRFRVVFLSGRSYQSITGERLSDHIDYLLGFRHVPSGLSNRLHHYSGIHLLQLMFLAEFQKRLGTAYATDSTASFPSTVLACDAGTILSVHCAGSWWKSVRFALFDPVLLWLRFVRIMLSWFTQSSTQLLATPCFCATDDGVINWRNAKVAGQIFPVVYVAACQQKHLSWDAQFGKHSQRVWDSTMRITKTRLILLRNYDRNGCAIVAVRSWISYAQYIHRVLSSNVPINHQHNESKLFQVCLGRLLNDRSKDLDNKMDPNLLKEREAFLKRARALPVVEKPRMAPQPVEASPSPLRRTASSSASDMRSLDLRPQLQGRFAVLSKIVKYMKQRHLERDTHPLSVEEILEETMLHDTPQSTIRWLEDEALPNNPKIRVTPDRKFVFRPRYDIRTRQDLYQLLKRHELKGLGGVYLDDIAECIPDAEKVVNGFGDHVIRIVTPHDKKTILFYNDKTFDLNIDEVFKQQWRAVSVEGIHESKIEEYLKRNGISSMSGDRKTFIPTQRKKPGQRRIVQRPVKLKDNEHVEDIIEDFSDKLNKK